MSKKSISKADAEDLIVSTFASVLSADREKEKGMVELGLYICARLSAELDLNDTEMGVLRDRAEERLKTAIATIRKVEGMTLQ